MSLGLISLPIARLSALRKRDAVDDVVDHAVIPVDVDDAVCPSCRSGQLQQRFRELVL